MVEIVLKENIESECNIDLLNKFKRINNRSINIVKKENYIKEILNGKIITDINIIKYYYWETKLPMEYLIEYTEFKSIEEIKNIILPNNYYEINYKCDKCKTEDIKYFPKSRDDLINNFKKGNKLHKDAAKNFMKYFKNLLWAIKITSNSKILNNKNDVNYEDYKIIKKLKRKLHNAKKEIELYKENGSASVCKKCINGYLEEERMNEKSIEDFIKRETNIDPSFDIDEYFYLRNIPYSEYLQTEHWKNIRERALLRANHKCRMCGSKEKLQVHHNTYNNIGNERNEDLTVLCKECHEFLHDR